MKKNILTICFIFLSAYAFGQSVSPIIENVTNYGNGNYVVFYGYNNTSGSAVNIPVNNGSGVKNFFTSGSIDRGQPTTFQMGRQVSVWSLPVSYGTTLTWNLTGRTATCGTKNITAAISDGTTIMPSVGSQVTYTIKYANNEGSGLSNGKLVDTIPAGTSFVSATGGGVALGNVVSWNIGSVSPQSSGSVTVTLLVTAAQSMSLSYRSVVYFSGQFSGANYRAFGSDENIGNPTRTTDSSYIVAFEDLKNSGWNDWDVNDFVAGMRERVTFNGSNQISQIVFDYEALARGSAFVNKFHHSIKISGNSTATLVVKDSNGVVLPSLGFSNKAFTGNIDVPIFPNTYNALPPRTGAFTNVEISQSGVVKGYTATLTINTDGTSNTTVNYLRNSSQPYLINELNKQINIASLAGTLGNTQNVDNIGNQSAVLYGYFLDLGYRLPYDWKWSLEVVAIWNSFPQFDDYILSGRTLNTAWYNSPDLNKVWTRRIVTDNFPFTGEPAGNTVQTTQNNISDKHILSQNYPNPFNPTTKISFSLPKGEFATVKIFDMSGKEVAQLVNGEMKAGTHEYQFDGSKLSSGIYFYRINTASFTDTKRMILVK
jgi:LruC domain-containing protein/uncharacterized repeat protein (TIGR01451 family)